MEWDEPDTLNGIVRQYIITYNLSGSDVITLTGTARRVTIGNLLPFTVYEFTVVALTIETGPGASDIVRTEEAGLCVLEHPEHHPPPPPGSAPDYSDGSIFYTVCEVL